MGSSKTRGDYFKVGGDASRRDDRSQRLRVVSAFGFNLVLLWILYAAWNALENDHLPWVGVANPSKSTASGGLKSAAHFSSPRGWMGNPAAAFYEYGTYHLYYEVKDDSEAQGCPYSTSRQQQISWAHATSTNLVEWDYSYYATAIPSTPEESILSGSIVIDQDNTSGLFLYNRTGPANVVAFYTSHRDGQYDAPAIATSSDEGHSFQKYKDSPVVSAEGDLKHPHVSWHEETRAWVMTVARGKDGFVSFYKSSNLLDWTHISDYRFPGDLLGEWESASLVSIPVVQPTEDGGKLVSPGYVLVVSFTDGSPISKDGYGSVVRWFPGSFDGHTFVPADDFARVLDIGPDFYAPTFVANYPSVDAALSLSRAANLRYADEVPTKDGRKGIFTLPRDNYMMSPDPENGRPDWKFFSRPANTLFAQGRRVYMYSYGANSPGDVQCRYGGGGATVDATLRVDESLAQLPSAGNTNVGIDIGIAPMRDNDFVDRPSVACRFALHQGGADLDCHRNGRDGDWEGVEGEGDAIALHDVAPMIHTTDTWHVQAVFDRNILEIYLNGGEKVGTMSYFLAEPASSYRMVTKPLDGVSMELVATSFTPEKRSELYPQVPPRD